MTTLTPELFELATKANDAFYARMGDGATYDQFYYDGFIKEFFELIIEKCVYICEAKARSLLDARLTTDDFTEKNRLAMGEHVAGSIAAEIKERFGIPNA
jgi:hypothetical protein